MDRKTCELARKLGRIQARLRQEMIEELLAQGEDLESVFDPLAFSPLTHELREKYLSRLYLIQGLLQQLSHLAQGRQKHTMRVLSVVAEDQQTLITRVNQRLGNLNGARVLDVKFIPGSGKENWSALITYEQHPLIEAADETAAWM